MIKLEYNTQRSKKDLQEQAMKALRDAVQLLDPDAICIIAVGKGGGLKHCDCVGSNHMMALHSQIHVLAQQLGTMIMAVDDHSAENIVSQNRGAPQKAN